MKKAKVGIIGCGNISAAYFRNCNNQFSNVLDVVACADLDVERARARAGEYGTPKACSVDELLADPDIEIVINLTIPKAHAEVCQKALHAGKHVYVEKPLAVTREEGASILELADRKGLLVGSAPDTFLGGGIQTCRKLIDDGAIGVPVAATAFMLCGGHESWHPDPDFYYQIGGGPMFDMGPYYLTALVNLIGPIRTIAGMARITHPERIVTSKPKYGTVIRVNTPTHVAGVIEFAGGAIGTMITSFDTPGGHHLPNIEIYGTEGSLIVPDPNAFSGPIKLRRNGEPEWTDIAIDEGYKPNDRGIGVADMAYAIRTGRPHRANGKLAFHVLEAMHAFHDSSRDGKHYTMRSECEAPAALSSAGLS